MAEHHVGGARDPQDGGAIRKPSSAHAHAGAQQRRVADVDALGVRVRRQRHHLVAVEIEWGRGQVDPAEGGDDRIGVRVHDRLGEARRGDLWRRGVLDPELERVARLRTEEHRLGPARLPAGCEHVDVRGRSRRARERAGRDRLVRLLHRVVTLQPAQRLHRGRKRRRHRHHVPRTGGGIALEIPKLLGLRQLAGEPYRVARTGDKTPDLRGRGFATEHAGVGDRTHIRVLHLPTRPEGTRVDHIQGHLATRRARRQPACRRPQLRG